ncbi:hypothetical protein EIP91_005974 [Steccherinum ochraceum]|uniref:PHD-type domain-containing protein n=1 Tax=Steccherinum ochraceum TaxID=92696 RepID=A0A4R0R929_9APHY|nr:hypothetical protein EIP91_005974 [Steccherinum ochraceum]
MPRRLAPPHNPDQLDLPDRDVVLYAHLDPLHAANLKSLRLNWKWAAVSQFFYTFAPLLALNDVSLSDIEDDLARPSSIYLPRLMSRLLITLTQDRKINVDNWQTALRKQYWKRLPEANPIGPEPQIAQSEEEDEEEEAEEGAEDAGQPSSDPPDQAPDTPAAPPPEDSSHDRPADDASATNGLTAVSTPAEGTPSLEPSKPEAKRKPRKKGKGSRAHSRVVDPPMQFEGESKDWFDLELLEKLDSLHLLIEWQFQNPQRLRLLMKDDDETAQWRVEPIGYDAKTNAYWLIGPDRLWIQRAVPKPPRSAKRKRPPVKSKAATTPRKSAREQSDDDEPAPRSAKRSRTQRSARTSTSRADALPTPNGSRSRAAKVQANKKLDAQAKDLAEFQRQTASAARAKAARQKTASPQKPTAQGTRASARLRGSTQDDDEWQEIPREWLKPSDEDETEEDGGLSKEDGNGDDGGDVSSELTELSDSSEVSEAEPEEEKPTAVNGTRSRLRGGASQTASKRRAATVKVEKVEDEASPDETSEALPPVPADFVEWELICITLYDWEHVADPFIKATHRFERALYKVLTENIVPIVTAELKEIERKRKVEEALVHRKRSSRIATKETEKEEARLAAAKKVEEEEKEARAKRADARAKKEQAEREKRERARDQRRIEREEREERARRKEERAKNLEAESVQSGSATPSNASVAALDRRRESDSVHLSRVASRSSTSTPDWILDCEICRKSGRNIDDGLPMVSCNSCGRWQHITCHDRADAVAGRQRRNWESQQFYCQQCRAAIQSRRMAQNSSQTYMAGGQQHYHQPNSYSQKPQVSGAYSSAHHQMYRQPTSDLRYSQSYYSGDSRESYPSNHHATSPTSAYPLPAQFHAQSNHAQPSNGYAQYPQDQRSMYSSGPPRSAHPSISNGYPAADQYARHQPPVPVPQRSSVYEAPAMSSLHQNEPHYPPSQPSSSQYRDPYPPPQARWTNGGDHYYTSSNGIPSRNTSDLNYLSRDANGGGPSSAWSNAAMLGERDTSQQQPIVSPSGYTPTYNYPGP